MSNRSVGTRARVFAWAVIVAGGLAGWSLLLRARVEAWNWPAIVVLGSMAVATAAVSLARRTHLPTVVVFQSGAAFLYALFLLSDPASVCVVIWLNTAADWAINRRRPLKVFFNLGQLTLALAAAVAVRDAVRPGFVVLDGVDPRTMAAVALSVTAFVAVNLSLAQIVTNLTNRRSWYRLDGLTVPGLLNEVLCVASGIGMALLWWLEPWLVTLGALPLWIFMSLLATLGRREQLLSIRERELDSLQGLGLRIGAELEAGPLGVEVVRVAREGLQASGALLALLDATHEKLVVRAHHGLESPPPPRLEVSRLADGFFETGSIRRIEGFAGERELYPELRFLPAAGMLCAPLRIRGRSEGLLVVWRDGRRRPFDADDVRRLETLVRFVNVALSNSALIGETRQMEERLRSSDRLSAMGMLVSALTDQLGRPLASVIERTEAALSGGPQPARRAWLEEALAETRRALGIVEGLRAHAANPRPERRRVDVNEIVDAALDSLEPTLGASGTELVRRLDPSLPAIPADPHQLRQLLDHLLATALRRLESRRRGRRLEIETRLEDARLVVVVSDNGPGPSAETGLGLALCQAIVGAHGGRIRDRSGGPGQGGRLRVELPVSPGKDTPGAGTATGPESTSR